MKTTERQDLENKVNSLQERYNTMMRGRMVPSPKAIRLHAEIRELREEISRLDREAADRLALERAPLEEVLEIIAIPLLADVMNDLVAGVDATLRRNGCKETVFGMYTSQIRRAAMAMVDTLAHTEDNLPRLLEVDDTLVDAIRKKIMSFIRQRLKIVK